MDQIDKEAIEIATKVSQQGGALPPAAIAGIVIGSAVLLSAMGLAIYLSTRKKPRSAQPLSAVQLMLLRDPVLRAQAYPNGVPPGLWQQYIEMEPPTRPAPVNPRKVSVVGQYGVLPEQPVQYGNVPRGPPQTQPRYAGIPQYGRVPGQ